jgi:hypothetical protein
MTARPPPELAGELYCRANLEPMIYTGMSPQIATELLDRAWLMLSQGQISFSFNYIDKPKGNDRTLFALVNLIGCQATNVLYRN